MSERRLKSIGKDAIPAALEKAKWYRALNEPREAESICRDVLEIEPANQTAVSTLLLSLSDQFAHGLGERFREAKALTGRLENEYEREYYAGIVAERRAKCQYEKGMPGCGHIAYAGLTEAMTHYEKAEALRPAENDDAVLRWNTCARLIDANADIAPDEASQTEPVELE